MKMNELPFGLDKYLDKYVVTKKPKKPVSTGKILGIGAGIAAAALIIPYRILIDKEKKSFAAKSLALDIKGGRDENGEVTLDVTIPWIKKKCRECDDYADFSNCGDFGDLEDFEDPEDSEEPDFTGKL